MFRDTLRTLRRGKIAIICCGLVGIAAGGFAAQLSQRGYRVEIPIEVRPKAGTQPLSSGGVAGSLQALLHSDVVLGRALADIDASLSPLLVQARSPVAMLRGVATVAPSQRSDSFNLAITSAYPADAVKVAAAMAEALLAVAKPGLTDVSNSLTPLERASVVALSGVELFSNADRASVVAVALEPEAMILLAAIGGLIAGALAVLAKNALLPSAESPAKLRRWTRVECLGHLPVLARHLSPAMKCFVGTVDPQSPPAAANRATLGRLRREQSQGAGLLVTSAAGGEGRTTLAVHLSTALALAGERVLLIDADVDGHSLHKIFGLPWTGGLCKALEDPRSAASLCSATHLPDLSVLTFGKANSGSLARLHGTHFRHVLDALGEHYSHIIIDGSAWNSGPDTAAVARHCWRVVLAVHATRSDLREVGRVAGEVEAVVGRAPQAIVNALPYDGRERAFGVGSDRVPATRSRTLLARDDVHAFGHIGGSEVMS
jgi:Mrp family chromosome partitioning ATPase